MSDNEHLDSQVEKWDKVLDSHQKATREIVRLIYEDNEDISTSELVQKLNQVIRGHNDYADKILGRDIDQ